MTGVRPAQSIRQSEPGAATPVPDFRSPGLLARAVLAANALLLLAALVRAGDATRLGPELTDLAGRAEPALILVLLTLYLAGPLLRGWDWPRLATLVLALTAAAVAAIHLFLVADPGGPAEGLPRAVLGGTAVAALTLHYLYLRARAFSPALAQARLMALTARMRPHFLFNSLNAVLGTMRADPQRAERALEGLAELFRAVMRENRELVTLQEEIELARQYLDLEALRLGPRLQVSWDVSGDVGAARVPPLLLQPLLENAVYHGVEPAEAPGQIRVCIARSGGELIVDLANPYLGPAGNSSGNRMALDNIRERLALFFDQQAQLDTRVEDGQFRVSIRLPLRVS